MTVDAQDRAELKSLKVFISSPADVRPERLIAERVVARLDREFCHYLRVEAVMWEREPLVASQHFQESITPPRDTDIVVVILWSRLGVQLPIDKFVGPLSGRAVTGTEWEFEDALKATRDRKLPDLLMYRKKATITGSLDDEEAVQRQLAQRRLVEEFIKSWFIDQNAQSFTAAYREFDDASTFEDLLETHLRELLRKRIRKTDDESLPAEINWHQGSPFRGLLSFELEQAPVFFGRTRARNELRELLARQAQRGCAFVLVVGASGSGKSSVVKAGVLADLKLRGMVGTVALVRHAVFRPSEGEGDLTGRLASAILSLSALPELTRLHYNRENLERLLRAAPGSIDVPIRQGLTEAEKSADLTAIAQSRLLILVDQLEEIFTLDGISREEAETFIAALEGLARSGLVWVVATMRSDFFDWLEKIPSLLALSSGEARYVLAPPASSDIGQIIRQPAREAGLRFEFDEQKEIGLDELIREAAVKDTGSLPLLSFLLDQLWQRRRSNGVLTFAAYDELGGLEGALGRRAEEVFTAQPAEIQNALGAVLRALVTVGEDTTAPVSSRAVPLATFGAASPERSLIAAFLDPKARLLVADTDSVVSGSHTHVGDGAAKPGNDAGSGLVRVAHEALLSHWPRAKEQIEADRRDLALVARLENAATRWKASGKKDRDSLVLPRGLPLTEAVDLVRRWSSHLSRNVTDFVEGSRHVARRRVQRLILTLIGAVAALPMLAGIVWAAMVWHGVRAVEDAAAFVPVPAGCFIMGSPSDETGRFDHEVQHKICVKPFELGKYAVTQEEWQLVMVENPDPSRFKGDNNPVEMVSWYDAQSFVRRMNFFGHHTYRLPTEAEWEYAARAGTTTAWFWGDKVESGCPYANLRDLTYKSKHFDVDESIVDCEDGHDQTAPVGSFKPNPFGLYDMAGNIFQWTQDCFGDYAKAPSDGTAAESASCEYRVVRGGSWTSRPRFTRSASRDIYAPVNRNDVVGFRLAR